MTDSENPEIYQTQNKDRFIFCFEYTEQINFFLTFDELHHLLMGHGGHHGAIHLRRKDR